VVVHAYNLSRRKPEAGESQVLGLLGRHSKTLPQKQKYRQIKKKNTSN
jgi:hypothetical protein